MTEFAGFTITWYLMILLGAVFGKVMEDSGAADAVAKWTVDKLVKKYAVYRKGVKRSYDYLKIDKSKKEKGITGKSIVIDGGTCPIRKSISKRYFSLITLVLSID